jgi:FolB domain-containing protein
MRELNINTEQASSNLKITIANLKLQASIGIYAHEKEKPQEILITLDIFYGNNKSAQSDNIEDAMDYDKIKAIIESTIAKQHYNLLEKLSQQIIDNLIIGYPQIKQLKVKIIKPAVIKEAEEVSVTNEYLK